MSEVLMGISKLNDHKKGPVSEVLVGDSQTQ